MLDSPQSSQSHSEAQSLQVGGGHAGVNPRDVPHGADQTYGNADHTPKRDSVVVAVVGGFGQVGKSLALTHREYAGRIVCHQLSREDVDITSAESVWAHPHLRECDVIINAAAYTAVDAAEDPANHELAADINARGAEVVAQFAAENAKGLIHISTDYVFGSASAGEPLATLSPTDPVSVYGKTKLEGEQAVHRWAREDIPSVIVRTAWVYSGTVLPECKDFVSTMLRLKSEGKTVSVVDDQIGSPTFSIDLARGLWQLVELLFLTDDAASPAERLSRVSLGEGHAAIVHCVGSGRASWFDVARAVFEVSGSGDGAVVGCVRPCTSSQYPTPAPRPHWSVLSTAEWESIGLSPLPRWDDAISRAILGRVDTL